MINSTLPVQCISNQISLLVYCLFEIMHEIITYYLLNIYEKLLRLYLKETMIMIGFSGAFHTSCTVRLVDMKN